MPATDPKQILILDRDVAQLEPLHEGLCDAGFPVRSISDGPGAVAAMAQRPPHLIIIDWSMPGFAAREMISRALRVRVPHEIRLILLSTLTSEPDMVAGFDLGVDDYIAKPGPARILRSHCTLTSIVRSSTPPSLPQICLRI
jgi:DNA-binding response OmpR family regulator